ncbi:helix-turn-helix domain-containing protein [Catenuloplanes atrovinosus]|uniref:Transcriptional regulator with XRE-family HTH domain n=1 Tax=Catenuloplanes atrovinosus TaxID=137266 RepID=A0AAE4CCZ8_9ACTN|nr:helix-turn-helix transcriptional regulator [Catenuloplanes atrovinosus]MDR7279807.1 transcriptional regulator with XRE-family HTH domain [Catenuloplanes atrovinosus]
MAGDPLDDVDDFYVEVGRRIRSARMSIGMTQSQLGIKVGLTRTSITNLEAGRQRLPLHTFAAIENALGVASGSLLAPHSTNTKTQLAQAIEQHLTSAPITTREFVQKLIAQLEPTNEGSRNDIA